MQKKNILPLSVTALVLVLGLMTAGPAAADGVLVERTLTRFVDPVLVSGSLTAEVAGRPLDKLRLYAHKDGSLQPILFQIDEVTEKNGDWVMTGGPVKSDDLGDGLFDARDHLIFMASDTGDKVSEDTWPTGYTDGCEIQVIDPLNNRSGWAYLFYFEKDPPPLSSQPPYINYDYATETVQTTDYQIEYIITEDGFHTTFFDSQRIFSAAGGNGEDFVDRLKIRTRFKVCGIPINLDEESIKCNVIGHQPGPVRLIRRLEQYVQIAGIPALRVVEDVIYYRYTATVPVRLNVPIGHPKWFGVTAVVRIGTDYNPVVKGSRLFSSTTRPGGYLIDGKMDDGEADYPSDLSDWLIFTGEWGTIMTRTILNERAEKNIGFTMGLIDDENHQAPPESFPGTIGYAWQDWNFSRASKGDYLLYVEYYVVPHYQPGDEKAFLNYLDHPLQCRVNDQQAASLINYRPRAYEKRFQKHYSHKDIQKLLEKQ